MSRLFKQLLAEKVIDEETDKNHADLKLVSNQEEPVEIIAPVRPAATSAPRNLKNNKIFIVALVVLVLMVQGFFIFKMKSNHPDSTSTATAESAAENKASVIDTSLNGHSPSDVEMNANAIRLFKSHAYEAAFDQFRQLLKRHPDSPEILNNFGMTLVKLNKPKRAKTIFQDALKKSTNQAAPVVASIYNNLGLVNLKDKYTEEAISNFQKAVLIDHGLFEARLNLGRAFEVSGQMEEAVLAYESYIAQAQTDPTLRETLKKRVLKIKDLTSKK